MHAPHFYCTCGYPDKSANRARRSSGCFSVVLVGSSEATEDKVGRALRVEAMTDGDPCHELTRVPLVFKMAGVRAACQSESSPVDGQRNRGCWGSGELARVMDVGYRQSLGAAIGQQQSLMRENLEGQND